MFNFIFKDKPVVKRNKEKVLMGKRLWPIHIEKRWDLSKIVYIALRETSGLQKILIIFILSTIGYGKSEIWFHITLFCMG